MEYFSVNVETDHSVLDTEAELVLGVRPLDLDLDHGGAGDGGQLDCSLVLGVLSRYCQY